MQLDRRLLGWGLFFILLGGLPLLVKAGLLDPAIVRQWPLIWPVLLIGWGLGLLFRETPIALIGGAVTAITFGLMGGGALATGFAGIPFASGCTSNSPATAFASRTGELGATARVDIEFSCGTMSVGTAAGSATWTVAGTDGDGSGPTIGAAQDLLSISSGGDRGTFASSGRAAWSVTLPGTPVIALGMTLNAGEGNVELGGNLSSVNLTVNAGDAHVLLGGTDQLGDVNATVNAGSAVIGLPGGSRSANMSLNAGSLVVCLAPGSPIRVDWNGNLGSNDLDDAGLVKVDDETWTSAGFSDALPHLELNVSANAGSFSLDMDGTCDA